MRDPARGDGPSVVEEGVEEGVGDVHGDGAVRDALAVDAHEARGGAGHDGERADLGVVVHARAVDVRPVRDARERLRVAEPREVRGGAETDVEAPVAAVRERRDHVVARDPRRAVDGTERQHRLGHHPPRWSTTCC